MLRARASRLKICALLASPSSESSRKDASSEAEASPAAPEALSGTPGVHTSLGQKEAGSSTLNLSVGTIAEISRALSVASALKSLRQGLGRDLSPR